MTSTQMAEKKNQLMQRQKGLEAIQNWLITLYDYQFAMAYLARRVQQGKPSVIDDGFSSLVIEDIEKLRVGIHSSGSYSMRWKALGDQAQELEASIKAVSYKWVDEKTSPPSFLQLQVDLEWLARLAHSCARLCEVIGFGEQFNYKDLAEHILHLSKALHHCGDGLKRSAKFCLHTLKSNPEAVLKRSERLKLQTTLTEQANRRAIKKRYGAELPPNGPYTVDNFVVLHHDCHAATIHYHIRKWNANHPDNKEKRFDKEKVESYKNLIWLTQNRDVAQSFLNYLRISARIRKNR